MTFICIILYLTQLDIDVECFNIESHWSTVGGEPHPNCNFVEIVLSGKDRFNNLSKAETVPRPVAASLNLPSRTLFDPSVTTLDVKFFEIDLRCTCCRNAASFRPNCIFRSWYDISLPYKLSECSLPVLYCLHWIIPYWTSWQIHTINQQLLMYCLYNFSSFCIQKVDEVLL